MSRNSHSRKSNESNDKKSGACNGAKKKKKKNHRVNIARIFFLSGWCWMSLCFLFSFKREKCKWRIPCSSVHLPTRLFIRQSLVCLQFAQNEKQVGKCVFILLSELASTVGHGCYHKISSDWPPITWHVWAMREGVSCFAWFFVQPFNRMP